MQRIYQPLAILVLGAILGIGWIFFSLDQPVKRANISLETPARTDYYMRNSETAVMNERGTIAYRITADETLHYPDKSARMTTVHVDYLDGSEGVWKLDAVHGQLTPAGDHILLTDGVRIYTDAPEGQTVMTTPESTVNLHTKLVTSAETVNMQSPGYKAKSFGMEAGFQSRDVTLLQDVQSEIYVH